MSGISFLFFKDLVINQIIPIFAAVIEIEAEGLLFFVADMDRELFEKTVMQAASERGCSVVSIDWNDDDNVFEVTIDRADEPVGLDDCEFVHRAVLAAFNRDIEDYALTVGSLGLDADQADEILKSIQE